MKPGLILSATLSFLILAGCKYTNTVFDGNYAAGVHVSAANSSVSTPNNSVARGSKIFLTLSLRDENSQLYTSNNAVISFRQSGGTSVGTFGIILNNLDGTYSVSFTGDVIGTPTTIIGTVNGIDLPNPPQITVSGLLTVTSSVDAHVTLSPNTVQSVAYGATQAFTATAAAAYALSPSVGGTCAAGTWTGSTYTTGAITADCSVSFSGDSLARASLNSDAINIGSILVFAFKEASGSTLYDISPAGNNGNTNGVWSTDVGENKAIQTFNVPAQSSQTMSVLPNTTKWAGLTKLSAFFRLYIHDVNTDFEHFFTLGGSARSDYLFFRPSQGGFRGPTLFTCCNQFSEIDSPTPINSYFGGWHDFAMVYDNVTGDSVLYTDGAVSRAGTIRSGALNGTVGAFAFFDGDSAYFQVKASVVRFWSRAITPAEAAALHVDPMTGITAP